jgi:hypothetical protein
MSTDEQKKQPTVKELLDLLDSESLRRAHNSVNISFKQMLGYTDKVRDQFPMGDVNILSDDINILLKTYRTMAERFYTQYELSVLMELVKLRDVKQHADTAIDYIGKLPANNSAKATLVAADPLLVQGRDTAESEYQGLAEKFPVLLQDALDKLRNEWQRLAIIASASQVLQKDKLLNRSIKAVVEVAAHTVGIGAERIVIVPGSSFALFFFAYLENFAVLTVPIYSVQAPWEWSIFWHELAGYKVRQLEKSETLDIARKNLINAHILFKTTNDWKMKSLVDSITLNNQFGRSYLKELFSRERLDLIDLGGFEHQFERMLINLPSTEKFQLYDQIKAQGWCVDWFKELFEDAWSVLAVGEPFLEFFEDVLGRNVAKDLRHPPMKVRLSVASEIVKLLDPESKIKNEPDMVEEMAAQQILKFISLLVAAARKFDNPDNLQSLSPEVMVQNIRDWLFDKVREEIRRSITNWSGKFLAAANPSLRVENGAKKFLDAFSNPDLEKLLSDLDSYEKSQITPSYTTLLENNKGYKKLSELKFYDADFGVSTVTEVIKISNLNHVVYQEAKLKQDVSLVTAGAEVTFVDANGVKEKTTIEKWNVAAVDSYKL